MQLGAHVSAAGGVEQAPPRGREIGCDCIQLFTRNQRTWNAKAVTETEVDAFRRARRDSGITTVMSHGSYLVNPAAPEADKRDRSLANMVDELGRCHRLGIELYNFHPGAHLDSGREAGIARIAQTLDLLCDAHPEATDVTLVLENVAGQGTTLGRTFEELAAIIEQVRQPERFAVCLDTAHAFAAGYALHTESGWEAMLETFERTLGLDRLAAFHVNDSKAPFDSRKDRHALLGRGEIGPDAFIRLVTDPRTRDVPMFLETPAGPEGWALEIAWLRAVAAGDRPPLPQIGEIKSGL